VTAAVAVVIGTRPEAIKLAPVVRALRESRQLECRVYVTGQHRQMLDPILGLFRIVPDEDLELMRPNQTLASLTALAVERLTDVFSRTRPALVLVQGDTTSAMAASLAAFYSHVAVGHVEAGLRTYDKTAPYPEEINRRIIGVLADLHFAPTAGARDHLLAENTPTDRILVTGNTGIDSIQYVLDRLHAGEVPVPELASYPAGRRVVLVTGHRRESFGDAFRSMCLALRDLAQEFADVDFVYPVHLNPNVQAPVRDILGDDTLTNFHLVGPMDYVPFVALMERSTLIITDSGGIQEEAPSLRRPVLVMRNVTERPEGIDRGFIRLVGTSRETIRNEAAALLRGTRPYAPQGDNPYGDGHAARRIVERLERDYAIAR
jgi:UDP-N-acetylglucosamine 2-epimerase (non-hydrolysing)